MTTARFTHEQLASVRRAERDAIELVRRWYVLAPRELDDLRFEVLTVAELAPDEILAGVLAHVRCYERRGPRGGAGDVYRICLQDPAILARSADVPLDPLMLYVLTHELVHVVRFGCELQRVDLPLAQRAAEEAAVDRTARRILVRAGRRDLAAVLERFRLAHQDPGGVTAQAPAVTRA